MKLLDIFAPKSGRVIREDDKVINVADILSDAQSLSKAFAVIDAFHNAVHEGVSFDFNKILSLGANQSALLLGRISSKQVHFNAYNIVSGSGNILLEFYESPTVNTLGTEEVTFNKNRASSNIATMKIFTGGDVVGGVKLYGFKIPDSSTGVNRAGGTMDMPIEWLLKPNTDYLIKITNLNNVSVEMSTRFFWYEPKVNI